MKAKIMIGKVRNLKSPSPAVVRLAVLLADPDVDSEDIVRVIRQDGVMSAKLLALCNSAAFGFSRIGTVDQAVLMLGCGEITRLALALGFGANLSPALEGYGMDAGALWRHSLLTALVTGCVCDELAGLGANAGLAYTAGLVHDIGKVVLSQALDPEAQAAVREMILHDNITLLEAEHEVLGVDHAEVGGCLLEQWRLPDSVVEAVANHHKPPIKPRPELSSVVRVADMLSHQAGDAPGWGAFAVDAAVESLTALGLTTASDQKLMLSTYDARATVAKLCSVS